MNTIIVIRTIILAVGWPVLVAGSIYLFIKGREVYNLVKGSLVGKITKALVFTMLVEMYSLGIVTTAYMFENSEKGVMVGLPIFLIWFVVFVWSLRTLIKAKQEVSKLNQ
ncbi:MAG: hypothetical protein WC673_00250 [Candidatus Paceibacterota bacterium]|jgi:hypothetical protein